MDPAETASTLSRQRGVISRAQVLRLGGTDNDIERRLRRREWARVFAGVYADHTGPLTGQQREAAVDRWADLERDIAGARSGDLTIRVGWLQVLEAHRLADGLSAVLMARGWGGRPRRCGVGCTLN